MKQYSPKKRIRKRIAAALLTAGMALSLFACGESAEAAEGAAQAVSSAQTMSSAGSAQAKKKGGGFAIPEFRDAVFDSSRAEGNADVQIDLSSVDKGYVAMRCSSSSKIKFQVLQGENTYTYSVVTGQDQIFPLQCGDGHYTFKVMENIEDNKYAELYKCETDVKIADPFDPFLRPNQYANYTEKSKCVQKARSLAEASSGTEDFIKAVYSYVCENVTYDEVKASSVQSGYLPVPDSTMDEKKGICFDYASLAASMLRSMGVPTKIIFGYVAPDDVYHAWNKFYTEDGGWKLVEIKVSGKDWNRIDLTFAANGASSKFIGDGSNYMEVYEY